MASNMRLVNSSPALVAIIQDVGRSNATTRTRRAVNSDFRRSQSSAVTRGSVPYYGTYPGLRIPRPLLLVPHENSDSALPRLAEEMLALTKVNWNTTQFDQKMPAPIKAARDVGRILKHIEYGAAISPDFRKYT